MRFRATEIDIDVHKLLEKERRGFHESDNDVFRRLLKLDPVSADTNALALGRPWQGQKVVLPHGTALRMTYNGVIHEGQVLDGKWMVEGRSFSSPSGAMNVAVSKKGERVSVNGWGYWYVKRPHDRDFMRLNDLWRQANAKERVGAEKELT
jgi:hypothetical protein